MIQRFDAHRDMLIRIVGGSDTNERIDHYRNGWASQARWYDTGRMGYVMLTATSDAMVIRTYRQGDEERILPMFREIFGVERSLEHWIWKYRDNPFGQLSIAIAEDVHGSLAAHFSGYAVPMAAMTSKGRRFISYQGGDTMTHPAFRGAGIGNNSVLARTARCFYKAFCEGQTPFIYGFNTGVIRKLGERFLGYEYLPEIPFHTLKVGAIGSPSSWGNALWRLKGFSVDNVTGITDEYAQFFERVGGHYGMLVQRNDRYLRWRYMDCPDGVHHFYVLRRWGNIVGWGVFRRKMDVLAWGDALFDPAHLGGLEFFLSHVIRYENEAIGPATSGAEPGAACVDPAGGMSIGRIEAWFSPNPAWWSEALGRIGFVVEREPHNLSPCVRRFTEEFTMETLASKWYYTWGDSDLF